MRVLVVYATFEPRLRSAISDHLFAFRRYSQAACYYVNAVLPTARALITTLDPDFVIFHTSLLSQRWDRHAMARIERRLWPLRNTRAVKVALPQDEFLDSDYLCAFIREFQVDHVFSVASPSEWPKIYGALGDEVPAISQVLTGYLEDTSVARIDELARTVARTLDIGYRAWHAEPWLGRHGQLKTELASRFHERGPAHGLSVDISTRAEDTLLGDDWSRFLLSSRYTIGVEGGASILDRDGSLKDRTRSFQRAQPDATFADIEQACFPGMDGSLDLRAISPRHLEACATRTCQVLIDGDYNGVLRPGVHYVPLRADFSNLDDVIELMKSENVRQSIAERARRDIVDSGRYSYRTFVTAVLAVAPPATARSQRRLRSRVGYGLAAFHENASWPWLRFRLALSRRLIRPLKNARRMIAGFVGHRVGAAA